MIDLIITNAITHIKDHAGVTAPLGYAIPKVEPFDGQVNETQMAQLLQTTPAVFVAFAKGTGIEQGHARKWSATLNLIVVARNLSTPDAARIGKGTEVGANRIAEDMALLFDRQRLGLEIDEIDPMDITPIVPGWARTHKAAIVGVTLRTGYAVEIPDLSGTGLSEFLRARFDLDKAHPAFTTDLRSP